VVWKRLPEDISRRILDELRPETGDGDFVIASPYKRGAHLRSLKKQEALDLWGRRVEEIVGDGAPGAVVPFPARSGTATARRRVVDWRRGDRG
jgi:hypothetical protein